MPEAPVIGGTVPLILDASTQAPAAHRSPWAALLTRIADETELGPDGAHVAGRQLAVRDGRRLLTTVLTDALHEHYFLATPTTPGRPEPTPGRRGDAFFGRLADALGPGFLGSTGWRLAYRTASGTPFFVVSGSVARGGHTAASCFLDLQPGTAPEVFARLVTTLEGYGLGFDARLAGDPSACGRPGSAVVTVARAELPVVARIALRLRERLPFAVGCAVPAFTRPAAPGIALADEPRGGGDFGRERCRVIATGLAMAGPGAGPAERRAAILRSLTDACLDPAALHLDPGNPEFEWERS
jgi:hypothetical protein